MLLVPTYSQPPGFQSQFSFGDFSALSPLPDSKVKMNVQVDEEFSVKVDLGHDGNSLFSCPNDGCIQTYMRHSALENHVFYGKCELRPVKETLMAKQKPCFRKSCKVMQVLLLHLWRVCHFHISQQLKHCRKDGPYDRARKAHGLEKLKRITPRASFRLVWKLALNLIQPRLPEICDTPEMQWEKNISALKIPGSPTSAVFFRDELQNGVTRNMTPTRESRRKT